MARIGFAALVFIIATVVLPWWSVAMVGLGYGLFIPAPARAWEAGLAGVMGWSFLLALDAVLGSVGVLATRMAVLFQLPALALLVVTVVFAGMLAWAAAGVGKAVSHKP